MGDQRYIYKQVALFIGALLSVYGLVLIISWHLNLTFLLTLPPSSEMTPYLAAVCLTLSGFGLLSIYTTPSYNLPQFFGFLVLLISGLTIIDYYSGFGLIGSPFTSSYPFKMTFASSVGWLWASIPLLYWKPYFRSSYKDHVPFLFSLVLLLGGLFIITSYLAQIHIIYFTLGAMKFNFWGVLGAMIFGTGIMASCYYFKTTTMMSRLMRLPVFITSGIAVITLLVAAAFSIEGEESLKKLLHSKIEEIKILSTNQSLNAFKASAFYSLGNEYAFTLRQGDELVFENNRYESTDYSLTLRDQLRVEEQLYTFTLSPTSELASLFINRTVTYLIIFCGFTIAVTFGALFRMWQEANTQLKINEKLHEELEKTISLKDHILRSAEIGTWTLDINTNQLTGDALFSKLLGFDSHSFEGDYTQLIEKIAPKHHEILHQKGQTSLQSGKPFEAVVPIKWEDETFHHLLLKGRVLQGNNSEAAKIEGIIWDITDIKRTQLWLEVSESVAKLFSERKSIKETSQEFIEILNHQFGWEYFVLRFFDETETRLSCIEATSIRILNNTSFCERAHSEPIKKGGSPSGHVWATQKPYWAQNSSKNARQYIYGQKEIRGTLAVPIFEREKLLGVIELYSTTYFTENPEDDYLDMMVSLAIEFGQFYKRKIAEETQAELAAIVTNSPEGMYSVTTDGVIKSWNQGAETIFGWKASEMIGSHIKKLYVSDLNHSLDLFLKKASYGKEVENVETEAITKNGGRVWVNRITSIIRNSANKIQGACVIVEDITEKKELEKTKHEFISMVSHELRTPLTSIHGAIALMRADGSQSRKVQELMDVAYRNSERLTYLVNDILTIEKFDLGKLTFNYEIASMNTMIDEAVSSVEPLAAKKSIQIIKEIDSYSGHKVRVEKPRIIQVLLNFLSNAIKFSHEGDNIFVTLTESGDNVRVSVRDEGIGIPEEAQNRVFTKFFQTNVGISGETKGTGLGLYISKTVIEGMGGTIGFESKVNHGSTFYFELPMLKGAKL